MGGKFLSTVFFREKSHAFGQVFADAFFIGDIIYNVGDVDHLTNLELVEILLSEFSFGEEPDLGWDVNRGCLVSEFKLLQGEPSAKAPHGNDAP